MNQTEYNAETQTAKIQGGSLWKDVYITLEPYGVTVPGKLLFGFSSSCPGVSRGEGAQHIA